MTTTTQTTLNVPVVLDALEQWINQRPGLEYANYGDIQSYNAELRAITRDRTRALMALREARTLPPNPEALAEAFARAWSGRLKWKQEVFTINGASQQCADCGCDPNQPHATTCNGGLHDLRTHGELHYTTGQYWPTEYRKAAASVLEYYNSHVRPLPEAPAVEPGTRWTLALIKQANTAAGQHWFEPSTMRFFRSKVVAGPYQGPGGVYFVTRETNPSNQTMYTVRQFIPATGEVDTVGEFHSIRTPELARQKARKYARHGAGA